MAVRLVLVGERGVGKSSILQRFVENRFCEENIPTTFQESRKYVWYRCCKVIKVSVTDASSTLPLQSNDMVNLCAYLPFCVVMVYDVTNASSFDRLADWIEMIETGFSEENIAPDLFVIGNKADLAQREVETEQAETWLKTKNIGYMEASAKSGHNIKKAIKTAVKTAVSAGELRAFKEYGCARLISNMMHRRVRPL